MGGEKSDSDDVQIYLLYPIRPFFALINGWKEMLSRYEQETIVNYNAGEPMATVYTRDKAVMHRLDALVNAYPDVYNLIGSTDIDKTYSIPKSYISYRKPRNISEAQRQAASKRMKRLNGL